MPLFARVVVGLTRLLPDRLRRRFADDLRADIDDLRRDARRRGGRPGEAAYLLREAWSIVRLSAGRRATDNQGATMGDRLRSDVAGAWRAVRARPIFSVTAAATLAMAIASAATALGLATAILWRPLAFAAEEQLVFVWENTAREGAAAPARVTGSRYAAWRDHATTFDGLSVFGAAGFSVETAEGRASVRGVRVSAGYFDVLGVRPMAGRTFVAEDEIDGRHFVVVLSHDYWRQQFGGRTAVIGQSLRLSGQPHTIIGVMPPLVFPAWPINPAAVTLDAESRQVWVPMPRTPQLDQNARSHVYGVIGRVRAGVSLGEATADLASLAGASPDPHAPHLVPLRAQLTAGARQPLLILLASAVAVLLVGGTNLAALHLAWFERRRPELATRASLGAGAPELVRLITFEALMVAAAGGAAGIALARAALAWMPSALPPTVPFVTQPRLDLTTAAAAAAAALIAGVAFVILPIVRLLRDGPAPRGLAGHARTRAYGTLVTAQLGVTVALVSTAAWLGQSLWTVQGRDPGFTTEGVVLADVSVPGGREVTARSVVASEDRLYAALAARAGVTGVAFAYDHPLEANWSDGYAISGLETRPEETRQAQLRIVSPSYFDTLGIGTLDGRVFADRDGLDAPGAGVVNESFARRHGGRVIGRTLRSMSAVRTWGDDAPSSFTIVGVVEDERFRGLEVPHEPAFYLSTRQFPQSGFTLLVQSAQPRALAADLRAAVRAAEPRASVTSPRMLADVLGEQLAPRRLATEVLGGFAGAALLLAGLGLYGLLAIMVAGRTREVGVRMALGATPADVAKAIIARSIRFAAMGLAAGVLLSVIAARLVEALLVGVTARDPLTIAGVVAVMVVTALAASLVPALRAARVDAVAVLRAD
jgi:predicted permease